MKLVIVSDTHGLHDQVTLPQGDVLIHCGDCTNDAGQYALRSFLGWMEKQPYAHKILIAGNHDWAFEKWPDQARRMVELHAPSVTYLQDSGCVVEDFVFWGSPVTPTFFDWAFNRERGEAIKAHWDMIPEPPDVLITHGPPKGFLDYNKHDKFHCGCEELLNKVMELKPKLHCFGHIHQGYGNDLLQDTTLINASAVNERYMVTNAPYVYDLAT